MVQSLILFTHLERRRLVVSPSWGAVCYSIRLRVPPAQVVRVTIECKSALLKVSPSSMRFTARDWERNQQVFVVARLFPALAGSEGCVARLQHVVHSEDERFVERIPWLEVEFHRGASGSLLSFGGSWLGEVEAARDDQQELVSSDSEIEENAEAYAERAIRRARGGAWCGAGAGDSHALVVKANGRVFACGANDAGQLGVGDRRDRAAPVELADFFGSRVIVSAVACGAFHSAAVTSEGEVYTWGSNASGQLGCSEAPDPCPTPRRVEGLADYAVTRISCGAAHAMCAAESPRTLTSVLFAWGNARTGALGIPGVGGVVRTPTRVPVRGDFVVDVSCGALHSAVVDSEGRLLTCGADDAGQLGRVNGKRDVFVPVVLPGVATQAALGGAHTLVLLSTSEIFACGDNSYGQLGLGKDAAAGRRKMTRVDPLGGVAVAAIVAGFSSSAALTRCGRCYVWGQCGLPSSSSARIKNNVSEDLWLPSLAPTISSCRAMHLALGRAHFLALTALSTQRVRVLRGQVRKFARDVKHHVKMLAYETKNLAARQRDALRQARRSWVKARKLAKLFEQIKVDDLTRRRVRDRAVSRLERARLDRILHKKETTTARRRDLFASTRSDRLWVRAQLQLRFARALYPRKRALLLEEDDSGVIRHNFEAIFFVAGAKATTPLRAVSSLFRASFDLALLAYLENLLRLDKTSRRREAKAGVARRAMLVSSFVKKNNNRLSASPPMIVPRRRAYAPLPAQREEEEEEKVVFRDDVAIVVAEAPVPVERPPPSPVVVESKVRRPPRRTTEALPPEIPRLLEAAILDRRYSKGARLEIPDTVKAKRLADYQRKRRQLADRRQRQKQSETEEWRTRQFGRWLKLAGRELRDALDPTITISRPSSAAALRARPPSASRARRARVLVVPR
ncbi:hypothetical protein CTAYLR_004271 [Chrysophaeum taylorii]|uniref:Uncharacterized protein n=1 Tax=Chrysophaeum taylorii TaxID=2483200 RepID=A0AAD7XPC1_9STRA|nr:hypothetical protein CTAYLR_004271 [Chrysophaeum taylorii]